jgi:hypothetical protein
MISAQRHNVAVSDPIYQRMHSVRPGVNLRLCSVV